MPAKLVVIGDSLSQGFQSGSISNTQLSYPAMIAQSLNDCDFHVPDFAELGGLPVNLERVFRLLADKCGPTIEFYDYLPAAYAMMQYLDDVEHYWERGPGSKRSPTGPLHRNVAIWGFEMGDCYRLSEGYCRVKTPTASKNLLPWNKIPEFAMYRTARRTLNPQNRKAFSEFTQLQIAEEIALREGGIDNLIFWLGANNCLGTVCVLDVIESEDEDLEKPNHQRGCTLWRAEHFHKLFKKVVPRINRIEAKEVFVATIPKVTIPPVSRGVNIDPYKHPTPNNPYYDFYTHFWIWDEDFRTAPHNYPRLTREQARRIDQRIDEYNQIINEEAQRYGWHVVDIGDLLNRLAVRRNCGRQDYQFPEELCQALRRHPATRDRFTADDRPILDTRYLRFDENESEPYMKYRGGLVSLDGVHPTTIGYGLIAYEFLEKMKQVWQGRDYHINPLNWHQIVNADSLLTNMPENLEHLQDILNFLYKSGPLQRLIHKIGQAFFQRNFGSAHF